MRSSDLSILSDTLADAVMDRPREFRIGKRRFCLWSPSLGMSLMLERHMAALEIDSSLLATNPAMEAIRLVTHKKTQVCDILAIYSFRDKGTLSDSGKLKRRSDLYLNNLDEEETVKLLLWILSEPKAETLISLSPLAEQREKQALIAQIKKSSNTITFGGTTIYGTLIDAACKAYGWTKHHVVWGIDLLSLRMMMADAVNTVYLSDEEAKKYGLATEKPQTIGMTPADFNALREQFKD